MTTLIVGASGATGRLLVEELLHRGVKVKAIVRSPNTLTEASKAHENLSVIQASVLDIGADELARLVENCDSIVSCLGHNMTFKGIYGQPRTLVTNATQRLCDAVRANKYERPVRFVLMNTTGNRNRDSSEPISFAQHCVLGLIRLLLPPHVDNEQAADYLRTEIGQKHNGIEWAAVRPDGLIDEDKVGAYEVHASPTRSAIFNAGTTSRINVAFFMAELITNDQAWGKWKGQMPVIYNSDSA